MPRLAPALSSVRVLFARTGNRCAFPGCDHPLFDEDNRFVAQICHIEAAEKSGERYNEAQDDEQRRSPENLVVLCYRHHVVTNDIAVWTPEKMRTLKAAHEAQFAEG